MTIVITRWIWRPGRSTNVMDPIRARFEATRLPKCRPTGRINHTSQVKRRRGAEPRRNIIIHETRVRLITWPCQFYSPCYDTVIPEASTEGIQEKGGAECIKGYYAATYEGTFQAWVCCWPHWTTTKLFLAVPPLPKRKLEWNHKRQDIWRQEKTTSGFG